MDNDLKSIPPVYIPMIGVKILSTTAETIPANAASITIPLRGQRHFTLSQNFKVF